MKLFDKLSADRFSLYYHQSIRNLSVHSRLHYFLSLFFYPIWMHCISRLIRFRNDRNVKGTSGPPVPWTCWTIFLQYGVKRTKRKMGKSGCYSGSTISVTWPQTSNYSAASCMLLPQLFLPHLAIASNHRRNINPPVTVRRPCAASTLWNHLSSATIQRSNVRDPSCTHRLGLALCEWEWTMNEAWFRGSTAPTTPLVRLRPCVHTP